MIDPFFPVAGVSADKECEERQSFDQWLAANFR
jgi:hypothetical protein